MSVMNAPQISSISARDDLRTEPRFIRGVIIAIAVIFLTVFVVVPVLVVFAQAFSKGVGAYFAALSDPEALSAIRLTLMVAVISVGLNLVFGLVAAWAIAKAPTSPNTRLRPTEITATINVSLIADSASGSDNAAK